MGLKSLSTSDLADCLGEPGASADAMIGGCDDLRFAADWHAAARDLATPRTTTFLPGWSRPIRVGALVSQASMSFNYGFFHDPDAPLGSCAWMHQGPFELISIVEPQTTHIAQVERLIRDYALLGGLISVTDVEALRTLDVILLGFNWLMLPGAANAILQAVRSGVGLLNEHFTAFFEPSAEPAVAELHLASTPVARCHVRPCRIATVTAVVQEESPLLPGLKARDRFTVAGCGAVYRPVPEARVLISKDHVFGRAEHHISGLGDARMPAFLTGSLGRGRVAVVAVQHALLNQLSVNPAEYLSNLLAWLAAPRRESVP